MKGADNHGYIVHHKCYISSANIFNTDVTLNFDNLELLCLACHNKEHFEKNVFDEAGDVKPVSKNILELAGVYKK